MKITLFVEFPVTIHAEYQPREHSTLTYPGCPESMDIEDVEICTEEGKPAKDLDDLICHVRENYDLEAHCWEDRRDNRRYNL